VTSSDTLGSGRQLIDYARADGLRVIVVPDALQVKLGAQVDLAGNPMRDLGRYAKELDESFEYDFIDPADMSTKERRIFEQTDDILKLARMGSTRRLIREIRISTTMRPDPRLAQFDGVWESDRGRIVIKRSALRSLAAYAGTLLHEATHVVSGAPDASLAFENALSAVTGKVAEPALNAVMPAKAQRSAGVGRVSE
jgi:hypothetical protein